MKAPLKLPELRYTKTTLANGLDVIVRRQGILPLVSLNLWYHVGSKNEERHQRGVAHLFEHLMFEGSEHFPGDFFKPLQRLGASINGSTSSDRTNYYEDLPAAHLEMAMAMESDRMGHLLPALTDSKLRIQKDVVKNEYRQNYANRPYGQVWRLIAEALYPPNHPYNWLTIGAMEDVEAATRDDLEAFFLRHYVPSNSSLAIVGDVDEDEAIALADRYFGPIAGGTRATRPWAPEVTLGSDAVIRLNDRVELERIYLAWPTVPQFHDHDAALVLLADILTRGRSSRLYRKLVVEEGLAQDVSSYQSGRELAGSFGLIATLRPGRSTERALELVDQELLAIGEQGVGEEELDRVLNGRLAGFIYALDNIGGFGGVADRLNAYNIYLGDPGRITSDLVRYQAVTAESIREVATRFLLGRPRVALTVRGRSAAPAKGASLDRSVRPAPAPATSFRAPLPEVRTLSMGLPLWVIPRHELPIVAMSLVLDAGACRHPTGQAGLAQLAAGMLDEGTTTRSSLDIARAVEQMGTNLTTSCGWDGGYLGLQCLTPHLAHSLDLAADVLRNPTFPEADWQRIHSQTLAALRADRDSADSRGHRALLRCLFPADHPYRIPSDGTIATVERIDRDQAYAFHRRHHGPTGAACVVAGDVDPDEVARLLEERLAGWADQARPPVQLVEPPIGAAPRLLLVDRPGAAQAVVRVGHVGVARNHPAYNDLLVLNHILGGQFTSRLNARLREEKGLTYGIRSHFDFRRGAGPFSVSASLQADRIGEALGDIRGEIEALLDHRPPTPAEVDDARRALIEGQTRGFETPASLASRYATLHLYGLPPDEHARFAERIGAVTVDSLRSRSGLIRPGAMVAVVVADADLVHASLEALGWAEVERLSVDELD